MSRQRTVEPHTVSIESRQPRVRTKARRQQARATVDADQEILSVVAHDLRNPLGVISLWAEQLLKTESEKTLGDSTQAGLCSILRNAQRMQRLIADLLDDSRLRTGRLPLEYGEHLLSELLADVAELRLLARQKRVRVEVIPPTRDRRLLCDRARVSQVLGNLLANAIKFSPADSTVTVSVKDDGAAVRFAVHDDGPGIASDALPKIFDRFWQSKKGGQAGVGLGLYIVKGIVESHGGHVSAQSQLGRGSTFYVSLPKAHPNRTAMASNGAAFLPAAVRGPSPGASELGLPAPNLC